MIVQFNKFGATFVAGPLSLMSIIKWHHMMSVTDLEMKSMYASGA